MDILEISIQALDQMDKFPGSYICCQRQRGLGEDMPPLLIIEIPDGISFENAITHVQMSLCEIGDVNAAVLLYDTGQAKNGGTIYRILHQPFGEEVWCYHEGTLQTGKFSSESYTPVVYPETNEKNLFPQPGPGSLFMDSKLVDITLAEAYVIARVMIEREGIQWKQS